MELRRHHLLPFNHLNHHCSLSSSKFSSHTSRKSCNKSNSSSLEPNMEDLPLFFHDQPLNSQFTSNSLTRHNPSNLSHSHSNFSLSNSFTSHNPSNLSLSCSRILVSIRSLSR